MFLHTCAYLIGLIVGGDVGLAEGEGDPDGLAEGTLDGYQADVVIENSLEVFQRGGTTYHHQVCSHMSRRLRRKLDTLDASACPIREEILRYTGDGT